MKRLLIIDDEPSNSLVLQNRLREGDYQVTLADSGAKGLAEAREGQFDAILIDEGLSAGVDSFEVVRRLKASPETAATPILMLSRHNLTKEVLQKSYQAGCEAFLAKAELPALEIMLEGALKRRAHHDDLVQQVRVLEDASRRTGDGQKHSVDLRAAFKDSTSARTLLREVSSSAPDGLIVVDGEGVVRMADRSAHELLGNRIEGLHLGRLAAGTGLEAFVRDAHTESRSGFRFELRASGGRSQRTLTAVVIPLLAVSDQREAGLRIVLFRDHSRHKVAAELIEIKEAEQRSRELSALRETVREHCGPASFLGVSPDSEQMRSLISSAASSAKPVLIQGERGVGKKHIARAMHFSGTSTGPFLSVHCGSLTGENIESELFGHVKGVRPDAVLDRSGVFAQANHGTVVLEHIDRLPKEMQQRVLEVVTRGESRRMGAQSSEPVSVRVVATSYLDLEQEAKGGRFHPALYQALSEFVVELPPLRERREDIPVLTRHFLERYGSGSNALDFDDEALMALELYDWPGNAADLAANVAEVCRRAHGSPRGTAIGLAHLDRRLQDFYSQLESKQIMPSPRNEHAGFGGTHMSSGASQNPGRPAREYDITDADPCSFAIYEKKLLLRALDETMGDKLAAAKLLGVGKSTLYRKLKRHDIS